MPFTDSQEHKTNIYVLHLEGGRYYIGKSDSVENRYQQHLDGFGSAWTRKYRPISLVETVENVSPSEEDMLTKKYMSNYGIENVRGGCYVEIELSKNQTDTLNREIRGAKDLCTQCGRKKIEKEVVCYDCGRPGHYAPECPEGVQKRNVIIIDLATNPDNPFTSELTSDGQLIRSYYGTPDVPRHVAENSIRGLRMAQLEESRKRKFL